MKIDETVLLNSAAIYLRQCGYSVKREVQTSLQRIDMIATKHNETLVIEAESSSTNNRVKDGLRQLAHVKADLKTTNTPTRYILYLIISLSPRWF